MGSTKLDDFSNLLLDPFPLSDQKIRVQEYLGGGHAGHVFRVRIKHNIYALKMVSYGTWLLRSTLWSLNENSSSFITLN